jgi:glycosyltransferase involved in cell wall biosynthesis
MFKKLSQFVSMVSDNKRILATIADIKLAWTAIKKIGQYRNQNLASTSHKNEDCNQNRLKILLLTPYHSTDTGGYTRTLEHVKYLGLHHQLVVVSFVYPYYEDITVDSVFQKYCDLSIVLNRNDNPPSDSILLNSIQVLKKKMEQKSLSTLNEISFDVVLFNSIFVAKYHDYFPSSLKILMEQNIESMIVRRKIDAIEIQDSTLIASNNLEELKSALVYLEKQEHELWQCFDLRSVVSDLDKQEIDGRCNIGKNIVVKNGIDIENIQPLQGTSNSNKILFMGLMLYEPNIDAMGYFVENIFPLVLAKDPTIQLCIAGRDPVPKIYDLSKDLPIEIIANPVDMSEVARECIMSIVPLRIGGGTRIKILHSMAMGLPVISTSIGSEGLNVINDIHLLIRDNPSEFAEAIVRVRQDSQLRQDLKINGRQLVETEYDWKHILQEFEIKMLAANNIKSK